ncbi:ABC transporter ATP-binding protein [Roseibium aestuarii]|uniref:ABC transporter ATP-binding protein n=1 Tax=Roseibium aestuarii TaxID=2600299 RepID=A0ABW4JUN9_9HYPH|nr:ABC transporter ATP-binding protein [Roseibium aestuarii]
MLEIRNLRGGYGTVEVLRGVSLDIQAGEIVALLGSNGVGKTTVSSLLSGLMKPWGGEILFQGETISGLSSEAIVDRGLIHVPEGRHIFPNLSIRENLELGAYRRARKNRSANLEKVTTTFPRLKERFDQKAGTLSGGEQQMLAIGRGMMAEPELLILDEPSIGLSPLLVEEMFTLIGALNAGGLPVLLVEQNVLQSMEIASRAFVMENGLISLSGPTADLMNDPELKRSYLGLS